MPDAAAGRRVDDRRMTNPTAHGDSQTLARTAFVAAPALLFCYGVIRLLNPGHGPGLGWTSSHLAFLLGLLLFAPVLLDLRRRASVGPSVLVRPATAALVVGLVGLTTAVVQAAIDIVVGARASTHADMSRMFSQVKDVPGVTPAIYTVGPILFYVALAVLAGLLAARTPRGLPIWGAVLVLVGVVLPAVNLDLIPEAAVLLVAAFVPLLRRGPETVAATPVAAGATT
jgi:hypothetical protein